MHFPKKGDFVVVQLGGDCGLELRGLVSDLVLHQERQGFVLKVAHGDEVVLYYEELDDVTVGQESEG